MKISHLGSLLDLAIYVPCTMFNCSCTILVCLCMSYSAVYFKRLRQFFTENGLQLISLVFLLFPLVKFISACAYQWVVLMSCQLSIITILRRWMHGLYVHYIYCFRLDGILVFRFTYRVWRAGRNTKDKQENNEAVDLTVVNHIHINLIIIKLLFYLFFVFII